MVISSPATRLQIPVDSFRRVPVPEYADVGLGTYVAIVDVFDLPDLSGWRTINVRDAKLTGSVPKAIRQTLDEAPAMFVFMNRGLVLTTERVHFDNTTSTVEITLADPNLHGLLDGGHTYEVIGSWRADTDRSDLDPEQRAFVRLEILEGFGPEQIVEVVEARNTSNQVKNQSLLELQHAFDPIKTEVAAEPYADMIAYKEYEVFQGTDETGRTPKPIDIRDIVSYVTVFDLATYGDENHPIIAYNNKAVCLKRFEQGQEAYRKVFPLLVDALQLWDYIHEQLPDWYSDSRSERGQGSRFGAIKGVNLAKAGKKIPLYYSGRESEYQMPAAFKYPILAALRALACEKNGRYVWNLDPFEALDQGLGKLLADVVLTSAMEYGSHTKLGRSAQVWDQCYLKAQLWALRHKVA